MANTLLVLGNGFDLACGLKSSFVQYLNSSYYANYRSKCEEAYNYVDINGRRYSSTPPDIDKLYCIFETITFWDLYFALPHICKLNDIDLWSDFEQKLSDFVRAMQNRTGAFKEIIDVIWSDILNYGKDPNRVYNLILKLYLDWKVKNFWTTPELRKSIDKVLFSELKIYELLFGSYIENQQNGHADYSSHADILVKNLVGKGHELVYLNTFNYSNLTSIVPTKCSIWHVNGTTECPIFGIDVPTAVPTRDSAYKYTKTYRRLELTEREICFPKNKDFSRIVVYGHSLNQQDYGYFYALFNRLNFSNDRGRRNGYTIEFKYSGYTGQPPEEEKRVTIERALKLLQNYNSEVLKESNFRLMDILYSNGAVVFKEEAISFV